MSAHRSIMTLLLAAIVGAFGACSASRCLAQYQPRRPTVSPYLNLTRFNDGGLPNYYALVRPQIQQQQFNAQARVLAGAQQQEIGRLQRDVDAGLAAPAAATTGGGGWFMVPGVQSRFLDTTGYYPSPIIRRGGR
jgi:hypothetical protein